MAPSHVKSFQKALTDNILRYEEQYGEISVPQNESFDQYGVKVPEDGLPN